MLCLFVPADRPDRFAKALASGADRVILDLEDGVRPEAKAEARRAVAAAAPDPARAMLRVNPWGSPFWADDIALAARLRLAALLPKAEAPEAVAALHAATGAEVIPQIETARGLDRIDALLAQSGVARAAFGHLDYALDIGAGAGWDALVHARQTLVWRSRVAGRAAPLDSVTAELDPEATGRDAARARDWGFGGKLLIHPAQIAPARAAFAPDPAQVDWARRVIAASGGSGAVAVDGRMVDKPVEDAARRILQAAGEG